ncbi:GNAT family N-acetyltransferase [Caldilinea sp.]|uniref:GNAT family N-acetyltransferase n=1 Tax=Caldilinea sp. TaxID=2293560 RepID=UPI002C8A265D|nr:GNAT family N-acetyltransferase [Anaerolineales bacterium]HQY92976.1 GNAT family N-acetyltransferase [Caldilinea sp.]
MTKPEIITLLPVDATLHTAALQAVYAATPGYWRLYNLPGPPDDYAAAELTAAQETPGRSLLAIVRPLERSDPSRGAEMIGVLDFRLHWPEPAVAYIALLMVAEPLQRRGIGAQAWSLLKPWLANAGGMRTVRVGVEQFNTISLKFWQAQGFALTGESNRVRVGDKFVRLLYMTASITRE